MVFRYILYEICQYLYIYACVSIGIHLCMTAERAHKCSPLPIHEYVSPQTNVCIYCSVSVGAVCIAFSDLFWPRTLLWHICFRVLGHIGWIGDDGLSILIHLEFDARVSTRETFAECHKRIETYVLDDLTKTQHFQLGR